MQKRKNLNDKIIAWIIEKAKSEYADDISLIVVYGSYLNGTMNSKSDVDCYFIPKTERAYKFARTFIIDGVGYDIFPISWENVQGIADLKESRSSLAGDVKIIFAASPDDEARFNALQNRLKENLSNENLVKEISQKRCKVAKELCEKIQSLAKSRDERNPAENMRTTAEIRKLAGFAIMTLAEAVAVHNHEYFHFGLKKQFENLRDNFPNLPHCIACEYKSVVEAHNVDEIVAHTTKMFSAVCDYLGAAISAKVLEKDSENESTNENTTTENANKNENATLNGVASSLAKIDGEALAGLYEEICSTFNKIYICCENGNYILAFLSAVCLQGDLDAAKEYGCSDYNLLGDFDCTKLSDFARTTKKIENDFVKLITANGGKIKRYENFEEFVLSL